MKQQRPLVEKEGVVLRVGFFNFINHAQEKQGRNWHQASEITLKLQMELYFYTVLYFQSQTHQHQVQSPLLNLLVYSVCMCFARA